MARSFAVRLSCSKGDGDTWVTLADREESLEQVFEQGWNFKCREHGEQRGMPKEVIELAPPDAPPAQTGRSISRATFSPTKKTPRSSPRLALRMPVVVYGYAGKGGSFHEDTETIMVNTSGALVMLNSKPLSPSAICGKVTITISNRGQSKSVTLPLGVSTVRTQTPLPVRWRERAS